jgi:O-acetyl-ADP-ribose deacetylase (regulator of RNase III)
MRYKIEDGDIAEVDTEVIVNSWNRNIIPWFLMIPTGVTRSIKKKSGASPFNELLGRGIIPIGSAVLTSAGRLPYKGIIHVAGINMFWQATELSITKSVSSAIHIVNEHGYGSIAFPVIGSGAGGFNEAKAIDLLTNQLELEESSAIAKIIRFR